MKRLFILIAGLACASQGDAQTIIGGDMETWKSYTSIIVPLTRPDGWNTSDSLYSILKLASGSTYTGRVTKSTTIKHTGTASAKLISGTDSLPSVLTNATIEFDVVSGEVITSGGTKVTTRISAVNAWIQYASAGSADTGLVYVEAYKNGIGAGGTDSLVGSGSELIVPGSSFTKVSAELEYDNATVVPDRIMVGFITSLDDVAPPAGTTMYVDDVTMSGTTGIETPLVNDQNIKVFPNPAVNELHVSTELNEPMVVELYNTRGQVVLSQKIQKQAEVNVSGLASGSYIYVISSQENGHKYYSATFVKQ